MGSHTQRLITRATLLDEGGGGADEELVGSQNVGNNNGISGNFTTNIP